VLINGFVGTGPKTVVIEDQDATRHEPRVQMFHLVLCRLVPIRIEAQQGYLIRCLCWDRVLDKPRDQMDIMDWVSG